MKSQRLPGWAINLILVGAGITFALIVIGVALAAFPQFRPNMIRFTVEMGDIFYHQAAWMRPAENPDDVLSTHWLEWDAEGFRVPYMRTELYPVVALGDSFTEAPNAGKPWPDVMAEALNRPVRNLGFRGFGPREEMQAFRLYGQPERAEVVVIGFFEGNDLSNAYTSRGKEFEPPSAVTNRDIIPTDVTAIANRDERYPMQIVVGDQQHDIAFLEGYIWALNGAAETYAESLNLELAAKSWRKVQDDAPQACVIVAYFPDKGHIYLPYLVPEDQETLLNKAEAVLLNDDRVLSLRPTLTTFDVLLGNLNHMRDAVAKSVMVEGLRFLDLTPILREAASNGEITYYTYDTHWNQRGHDLVGQALADYIQSKPCDDGDMSP